MHETMYERVGGPEWLLHPRLCRGELVYINALGSLGIILSMNPKHECESLRMPQYNVYTKDKVHHGLPVRWLERL